MIENQVSVSSSSTSYTRARTGTSALCTFDGKVSLKDLPPVAKVGAKTEAGAYATVNFLLRALN